MPQPGRTEDGVRLAERVPSPLAYLAVAAGDAPRRGLEAIEVDPAARLVWSSFFDARTTEALGPLRELASLATGEVEFTLNALLPRADGPALPLLTCRVELSDDAASRLREALDQGQLGTRSDDVAGRPTWTMSEAQPAGARPELGREFRIALAGRDLLASNSPSSLDEILRGAAPGATTTVHPDSIAADRVFATQRQLLGETQGAHVLHVDWRRLRERIFERIGEAPSVALRSLGLDVAEHVTVAMRVKPDAMQTSVLVDQPQGPEGLLAVTAPTTARKILANLAPLSFASLTLSIDPARLRELARTEPGKARGAGFVRELVERCDVCGVDFLEQVLPRLNGSGSAQLVLLDDHADDQGVAFSVGARSAAAARSLLGEVREAFERHHDGPPDHRRDREHGEGHDHPHFSRPDRMVRAEKDLLSFTGPRGEASLGVVGSDLVFASRTDTIHRMGELSKRGGRERQRARQKTQDICDRVVANRAPTARGAIGVVAIDSSALGIEGDASSAGGHAGVLFLDEGTLRVEFVSPR